MQAIDYQPRLGVWSHVWRYALVIAIGAGAWFELARWQWENDRSWFFADLALGISALVLVAGRRRWPLTIALVTNAITVVSASAGGPATLALVSLATRRRWREIIPVSVLGLAAGLAFDRFNPVSEEPWGVTVPILVALIAVTVGWGMYIGSRRELLATLRLRAETAESEQAARVAQARTAERTRIAREMHDVLAHRISMVTMHAGALSYRDDLTSEQVRETARIIQENSHQALVELRQVLGVLREDPGDADPERPQPSAVDLPELVDKARAAGMKISAELGPVDSIPDLLGRTAYRVVQEGLTNARKHAPDTLVTVALAGGPDDGLTIAVRNPIRVGSPLDVPSSGLGLMGLAERATLAGGQLRHGVTGTHEFTLTVWLPWPS
ncbi:MAG: sensor histidine kinase [Aeromicrobium sp.]